MMPHTSPAATESDTSSTATTDAAVLDGGGKALVTPVRRMRVMELLAAHACAARPRTGRTRERSLVGADVVFDVVQRGHELVRRGRHQHGGASGRLLQTIGHVL